MREILTVQIGGYANFVGSHFWNFQDETLGLGEPGFEEETIPCLNMDVLYRMGETMQRKVTYTPRLLSIDLRGSSGAVKPSGSLYDHPPAAGVSTISTWHGPAATFKAERYEKNQFLQSLDDEEKWLSAGTHTQDERRYATDDAILKAHELQVNERQRAIYQSLDDEVQFSTDYLKVHLHPSSTYEIPGLWQGVTPFEDYGSGQGLFSSEERAEEIRDKVRLYVEECDYLQGFQWIIDESGGFAAVAADILEDVVEEYGRTPMFLFTVRPPRKVNDIHNGNRNIFHALHDSVSLARLAPVAQLLVPLGLSQLATSPFSEHLVINNEKDYHTSAVYAAAINCITLPFRMKVSGPTAPPEKAGLGGTDLGTSLRLVSCSSERRVAMLEASFPSPSLAEFKGEMLYDLQNFSPLTPGIGQATNGRHFAEMLVLQGIQLPGTGKSATVGQVHEGVVKAHEISARAGRNSNQGFGFSHLAILQFPLAVPLPFPFIFANHVGKHGNILPLDLARRKQTKCGVDVCSAPVAARVTTSGAILPYIRRRSLDLQKLGVARSSTGPSVLHDWGFDSEEVKEMSENLLSMLAGYGEKTESDSSDTDY